MEIVNGVGVTERHRIPNVAHPTFLLNLSNGVSSSTDGWSSLTTKKRMRPQNSQPVHPKEKDMLNRGSSPSRPITMMTINVARAMILWRGPNIVYAKCPPSSWPTGSRFIEVTNNPNQPAQR